MQHTSKSVAAVGTGYATKAMSLLDTDKQDNFYEVLKEESEEA